MKSGHSKTYRRALENELGQLVERVDDLQADENKGCVHQIKAKMHDGLETINLKRPHADLAQSLEPKSIRVEKGVRPANSLPANENRRPPPPRK